MTLKLVFRLDDTYLVPICRNSSLPRISSVGGGFRVSVLYTETILAPSCSNRVLFSMASSLLCPRFGTLAQKDYQEAKTLRNAIG